MFCCYFLLVLCLVFCVFFFFFFKQKTAYEMRISDWSSDVCSSDLMVHVLEEGLLQGLGQVAPRREVPLQAAQHQNEVQHDGLEAAVEVVGHPEVPVQPRLPRLRHDGTIERQGIGVARLGAEEALPDQDRKSTRLNSSHSCAYRMPSST